MKSRRHSTTTDSTKVPSTAGKRKSALKSAKEAVKAQYEESGKDPSQDDIRVKQHD